MGGGYRDSDVPWRFTGRALYQLNLVKSAEARKHVPSDLKLVELFGYTLGGVYLARYTDSPAGGFDEMVALGGLVWNPPFSCAWAARVFVNDPGARAHGVKTCGLPSRLARFDRGDGADEVDGGDETHGWWRNTRPPSVFKAAETFVKGGWRRRPGKGKGNKTKTKTNKTTSETVTLRDGVSGVGLCSLAIPASGPGLLGPRISLKLPSFSGRTESVPDLLKYSLDLRANVRLSGPIVPRRGESESDAETARPLTPSESFWAPKQDKVRFPPAVAAAAAMSLPQTIWETKTEEAAGEKGGKQKEPKQASKPADPELVAILRGRPLLCIAFDKLEMDVGAPVKVVKGK